MERGLDLTAAAILFDMDGTLVDSTAVVEQVGTRWISMRCFASPMAA
jgi:phosphoglycolate phosphatase-like HAD superfamily hydrolase